ncbi:MAG: magnesium/cobalt transporter CorA, partial [Anaerolineae bacterium]|nr:magnesium/cobalt transporter CorA [Anaerolineae bacterium]
YSGTTWVNVEKPTLQDLEQLRQTFHFHPLDLEDVLSKNERPKIDEYEDYLFLVLQFPVFRKEQRLSFPSEVDIFLGPNYLVTAHDATLRPLVDLFRECEREETSRRQHLAAGPGRLLYSILDRMVDYLLLILNRVGARIRDIEENLFTEDMRLLVEEISLVRRDLVTLRRIVKPQIGLITNLELRDRPLIQQDLDVYFGDIADGFNKAWDILEDYHEVMDDLSETANALTSYRINEVMRVLTVISVIMLPLTLLSGIYGMNVPLPLADSPLSFALILAFMVATVLGMLFYFRRRGWV